MSKMPLQSLVKRRVTTVVGFIGGRINLKPSTSVDDKDITCTKQSILF